MLAELSQLGTNLTLLRSQDPRMVRPQKLRPMTLPSSFRTLLNSTSRRAAATAAKCVQVENQIRKLDNLQIQSVLSRSLRTSLYRSLRVAGLVQPPTNYHASHIHLCQKGIDQMLAY